ncbi:MAG: amylo-alpha-1,6-glucosidase [Anaerolineales bacterium]|jgi:predicted glycogen debranching enzyme|nr:amylo-alpha-1,6-glucosidase [Anaerolineales bacterium]
MIEFGRAICGDLDSASTREWLVTNGIGGYASGTIAGILTRRYHGLLIAALRPPLGRALLVAKIDETAVFDDQTYPLYANRFSTGIVQPQGYLSIQRFYLDYGIPTWEYALPGALIEKRIWMKAGENTTYIHYSCLLSIHDRIPLQLRALVNARDVHGATHANQAPGIKVTPLPDGMLISGPDPENQVCLRCSSGYAHLSPEWQRNFYLNAEAARGESSVEDHLTAGSFFIELSEGQSVTLVASTNRLASLNGQEELRTRKHYEAQLLAGADQLIKRAPSNQADIGQLVLAADQFIVSRSHPRDPNGKTVLAGYPWFSDWGRDTMIALPGLTLATGRPEIARKILRTFSAYVDQGMLPNRFPDEDDQPEYNTVDATLWFIEAIRATLQASYNHALLYETFPILQEIIRWHLKGTRDQIQRDPEDGLLTAGDRHTQLTWMDVRIQGWAVTPRAGKAVEINALWYNALMCMADFARQLNQPAEEYLRLAEKARQGFQKFWNPKTGQLYDVIEGPDGNDPAIRPNQLIAVSIHHSPLATEMKKALLDACSKQLLTSYGLRSLAPKEPGYIGRYAGDRWQRDSAYHQGTVWSWLIGPYISAYLKVYQQPEKAWSLLQSLFLQLSEHGLGGISEVFSGDPPHQPEGCINQAWGVAEILRVVLEIESFREPGDVG